MVYLKDLLRGIKASVPDAAYGLKINNVTSDSRMVRKRGLFIAVRGHSVDGNKFIGKAAANGAVAVMSDRPFKAPRGVAKITVRDIRKALPVVAGNFYRDPSKRLVTTGVTGTNGKTTITYLIENILKMSGRVPGIIGTINYRFGDTVIPAANTTPGPMELQSILCRMLEAGCTDAVMEVSSHALDQRRADNVWLDAAIFTNITGEHLDYHKTIKRYLRAKAGIFDHLKEGGTAILNNDDRRVAGLRKKTGGKTMTYGIDKRSSVSARGIRLSLNGSRFVLVTPDGSREIATGLIGKYNISNILAASAASIACGIPLDAIKKGIESFSSVPGRLEPVDAGQPFRVFVDFAHTEDALYNVLSVLKGLAPRRIITVFGCGGNRDRNKRPGMGAVACRFSDSVVLTSDNPRFERPREIIGEIETGIRGKFSNYVVVEERRGAIRRALGMASKDDIVVIAGKGHERYQIIRDKTMPFDDRKVARSVLLNRG